MINLEILEKILQVSESVLYVAIMDSKGNIIANKLKKESKIESEQEMLRIDLFIIKQMLDIYDKSFGKTIAMQTFREKIHQLVYYHDYMIIYVACEPKVNPTEMIKISSEIDELIKHLIKHEESVQKV